MWQSWGKTLLSKGPRQTQPREAVRTERNTTEFRGGKAKYNPHSQQCHWCCLCHTPRAEGRWAAKTNKSLEMLLGWWGGTPGSFCLQTVSAPINWWQKNVWSEKESQSKEMNEGEGWEHRDLPSPARVAGQCLPGQAQKGFFGGWSTQRMQRDAQKAVC